MAKRDEFEHLVDAFAEYEGEHTDTLRFLIELVCSLQIALDDIKCDACDSLAQAREIADCALNQ
jgi:hypothetical protein